MTRRSSSAVSTSFSPRLFVNHYGSTEIYTYSVHRDQGREARLRGPAGAERAPEAGSRRRDSAVAVLRRGVRRLLEPPRRRRAAIHGGWYHTGDVGHLDEDGDLWLDGRLDDMIVSGGENVHPLEVEDVLARHPGVREVAVVGAPDDRSGQRVVAVVVGTLPRRSSTRTASPRRSPASSARASTASSPSCRRARLGRSSGGCSRD